MSFGIATTQHASHSRPATVDQASRAGGTKGMGWEEKEIKSKETYLLKKIKTNLLQNAFVTIW